MTKSTIPETTVNDTHSCYGYGMDASAKHLNVL